jgi:quinohemoprotein ethanol dehydrogenase
MRKHSGPIGISALILGFALMIWAQSIVAQSTVKEKDWPLYGNDLENTRFQNVDQINPANVKNLQVAWVFHTGVLDPAAELEVSPIEVNGTVYITDGHDDVFAVDATTGQQKWAYKPTTIPGEMPSLDQVKVCCGLNNRGVVFVPGTGADTDTVVYGRLDDVVVALDAKTGAVVWKTTVADFRSRSAINTAPQLAKGLVIVGLAGGEFEIQGQVIALDAATGNIAWRFFTTQQDTWAGNSWQSGGAPVWQNPSVDLNLGLVYFGTGNASPDINGANRAGDNLFSSSVVALDLMTGQRRWSFQETHHDIWDYDSNMVTVLFPLEKNNKSIPALGHCAKNGNYYILDRRDGTPVFPVTEIPVSTMPAWQNASATQPISAVEPLTPMSFVPGTIDFTKLPAGMLLAPTYTPPQEQMFLIVPGDDGGCEGIPQAYSPRTKFVYYGARYEPAVYQTSPNNTTFLGSTFSELIPGVKDFGIFGATDTNTGTIAWKINVDQPAKSGMLVAGDLAFFGEGNGKFHAVNAATGEMLFTFDGTTVPNGGGAQAAPVAYVVNGKEYIVNGFGGNVPDRPRFPPNPIGDAVIAFKLP